MQCKAITFDDGDDVNQSDHKPSVYRQPHSNIRILGWISGA